MPATHWYKICLWRTSIHGVHPPSESCLLSLVILNSIADSSTTGQPIFNPSLGRHWTRRQLHARIKDVTVASILMEIAPLLRVVFENPNTLAILDLMADSSTSARPILGL